MAEKLTPQQKQAVVDRGGKLLVSAAAGSGKTKVLVDRLMGYLKNERDPANLDDFLIITYTKAAASELRGKIAAKLTEAIAQEPENRHLQRQMQRLFLTKISTVHGFCSDVLREYAYRLDLSADFRVADENECREIRETVLAETLDRAYAQAGENPYFRAFVDTQGLGRTDKLVSEIVLKVYDSARCHLDPELWLKKCLDATSVANCEDASETLWGSYLVDELMEELDQQIRVMSRCVELSENAGMDKVTANLRQSLNDMIILRGCTTWDEILNHRKIEFSRLNFPRKDVDLQLNERIKACRNGAKATLDKVLKNFVNPSAVVLEDLQTTGEATAGLVELVRQFGQEYDRAKRSRRCMDFGDLEHKMLDLVLGARRSGPTAAAREIGARFREIMVDEYQDSNGVQDAIFGALTQQRNNCFMVGDVKQSIYQFRLADPSIFLKKYHSFLPAEDALFGQDRKVLLSANFRSGCEVISAVNDVFTDCMSPAVGGLHYTDAESLKEGIPHTRLPDSAVEFYGIDIQEDTYAEESAFVAQRIREMLDEGALIRDGENLRPVRAEDIVILLRSPGSVGEHFRLALARQGIRCTSGGGMDLLKTPEIGTLRSILQTVANPRQDIPLVSALASPVFGFTADDLAALRSRKKQGFIYDALLLDDSDKTAHFLSVLDKLRSCARMNPISRVIQEVFALTRMDSIFAAMENGQERESNLQTIYGLALDYETTSRRELGQFLEYLDSLEEKGLKTDGEDSAGAVTIMSIHKSKGLEFPVVFLCGLGREFNRESLRAQVLCHRELCLGLSVADPVLRVRYGAISKTAIGARIWAESISEEMRVLYVAMTRARDRLVMTYASRNLQGDIADIALRFDIAGPEVLNRRVVCPGEWVLLSALQRTEAGELHNFGGRPGETRISDYPWKIRVVTAPEETQGEEISEEEGFTLPENTEDQLKAALGFSYPHWAATQTPSKQTATQKKGRQKDTEAAEQAAQSRSKHRTWRRPSFAGVSIDGRERGTAMHLCMQHIRFDRCENREGILREITRLVEEGFLTLRQGELVDADRLVRFFGSELGRKLMGGAEYIREFKFSLLEDGSRYGSGLDGERVLLQGVVDCALLEDDGIMVLDFKTDYVTEDTLEELTQKYQPQVEIYAKALERIYGRRVKASYLYFFHMNHLVKL